MVDGKCRQARLNENKTRKKKSTETNCSEIKTNTRLIWPSINFMWFASNEKAVDEYFLANMGRSVLEMLAGSGC